jgi:hypothetical protein
MVKQSTTAFLLALALGPGLASGCYSGLDSVPQHNGGAQADGGGDGAADGADGADGADDGAPQTPDPDDPNAPPFRVPSDEARLLPFPVRMANLARVTGQTVDHPMFLELYELRYQLGDHDFASGVAPDLRWSAERMQYWVRGLKPVCASAEMAAAYPDLLTDPRPLMRQAWGHEPAAEEVEAVADLQNGTVLPEQQFMVTCIAVLTGLDFVSI